MRHLPLSFSLLLLCFLTGYFLQSCATKETLRGRIPYPQPLPGSLALRFLPGVVSTDSTDFNAAFSPDGQSVYFTRNENKKLVIYCSRYAGGKWNAAQRASFNEPKYSFADPAFSPDGRLYFISDKPKDATDTLADYDIWFLVPAGATWSDPVNAALINSDSNEFYVSFAANGNLYFASSRAGGFGQEDLYVSKFLDGQYGAPVNLGPDVNTEKTEYDPGVSPDENKLVFSSRREDAVGGADLYYAQSDVRTSWNKPVHLGNRLNTAGRDYCAYFSPDSKYFFFSSEKDVKWIDANALH
jgi:Tol biopolymer transport system component